MPQEKFHYKSLEEVKQRAAELGVDLPFAADTHVLAQPLTVRNITFPNRLGIAPMEGADSTPEGAPTEYTTRRYVNEAIGGSSVIWFEAISIVEEGRSSKTQLLLTCDTLDEFKKMTAAVKEAGLKANGYAPYLIMQANHSGRYSNPGNKPAPMIAYRHPILEQYRAAEDGRVFFRREEARPYVFLEEDIILEKEIDFLLKKLEHRHQDYLKIIGSQCMGAAVDEEWLSRGVYNHFSRVFFLTEPGLPHDDALPAGEYACLYYRGAYDRLEEHCGVLLAGIAAAGRRPAGPPLELYRVDAHDTNREEEYVTELQMRVE